MPATMVAGVAEARVFVLIEQVLPLELGVETFSDPVLVATHALTDGLIGLSYFAISATLVYLVHRARRDIPFGSVLLAFGAFIIACGAGHLLHIAALYAPGLLSYSLFAVVQGITVAASVLTATVLPPLVPKVLTLLESARLSDERKHQLIATNQQLAAANARLEEASELKTRFFANVSHDLRTPLTLILGSTETLLETRFDAAAARLAGSVVERNARVLLRHVNDLLDVAKLDAGKLELNYVDVDLHQLVERMAGEFQEVAHQRAISLTVEAPSCKTIIQVDLDKLERVLTNLLANALAFTPDSGQILCVAAFDACTDDEANRWASVSISDTGPGVPEALRATVFERFQQVGETSPRGARGTGLGLAIVKEFVQLHGGTVTLGESPSGGAVVRILLPVQAPAGATVSQAPPVGPDRALHIPDAWRFDESVALVESVERIASSDACQPLILVAEDDPQIAHLVADVLRSSYRVAIASDGQAALEQAVTLRPDLILSDIRMPGLTGQQLLGAVRARRELDGVPFVVLSASADDALRVQLLIDGAQDYVSKPFSATELRARVAVHMQIKRARDILQRDLAMSDGSIEVLAREIGVRKREALEALHARETFIAVAAHELKTPVTSLRGYAQLVALQVGQPNTNPVVMARAVRTLEEQSGRLTRLVSTLLESIGLDAGKVALNVRNTDLAKVVRHACQAAQATTSKHVINVASPPQLFAQVDSIRIEQVVTNLLDNALKFTPSGGPVEVDLSLSDRNEVTIVVRDHGTGIPLAKQARVKERFYQAHDLAQHVAGLGLGLHICQQIVGLHGGRLELESPSDGGTVAVVKLPVNAPDGIGPQQRTFGPERITTAA